MSKNAAGAMALILLWLSFVAFYVAFHPGGLQRPDGKPAQNPRDVILWFMDRFAKGSPQSGDGTVTA